MATVQDIVRRALRAMGVLTAGEVPSGQDAADGVERFQSLILGLPGLLHGGRWNDVTTDGAYTAKEGDRITVTAPGVVTLPATVEDGDTGCTRAPRDLAKVQILGTASNAGLWLYAGSVGEWRKADGLTISSQSPLGPEDDEGLAAQLAGNMVEEYGAEVSARTLDLAQISARSIRSRLYRTQPRPMQPVSDYPSVWWA